MDSLKELLAIAVFLAFAAVFLWMLIGGIQNVVAKKKSPYNSAVAEISEKRSEIGTGEFAANGVRLGKKLFTVTFRLDSGETIEFTVSEAEFKELNEGDRGHLTYRGNTYLGFTPDMLA